MELDSGKPDKATLAFERVMAVDPDYAGARLDMARAYYQLGDLPRAKTEFETVLKQNPSEAARVTIQKYLDNIAGQEAWKQTRISGYVEGMLGQDSNVNKGQQDGTERSFFSLFKGGFRAITGLIGKMNKANYRITTPASVIGIRGTDHETFVVTPDSSLAAATPIGTYNKVNLGETSMTTEKGTVFVLPNQMGFAGAADQMPQLQPINLNIFTVTAQPAPQASGDKHEGNREGGREVRETSKMDKNEMRETTTTDKTGVEGAATLTPSTEDAVTNTIPKTTGGVTERPH